MHNFTHIRRLTQNPVYDYEIEYGREPTCKCSSTRAVVMILTTILSLFAKSSVGADFPADLFGYREIQQREMQLFGQWLSALERHILEDTAEVDCTEHRFNRCHLRDWLGFLEEIRSLPPSEQLVRVNRYANEKRYVLDIDNYNMVDYWAIARQFLYNGGDCEDYAITKFFSLRWLGFRQQQLRIVVLQDTNLRIPHAVLAVSMDNDIRILDNQLRQVVTHRQIVHYVPVYSINEHNWWIHTPAS
jgi:predicted transglutaminase-like cysteine proteinase